MAKTYSTGGVAHGAKYWRLTINVRESDRDAGAARRANIAALRRKGVQAVLQRIPPRTGKKDGGDPRCLG